MRMRRAVPADVAILAELAGELGYSSTKEKVVLVEELDAPP